VDVPISRAANAESSQIGVEGILQGIIHPKGSSIMQQPIAYFVRHGETAGNAAGKFRGQSNIPLNSEGKRDAVRLGDYFKDIEISNVYSSDKDRARDTAEEIARPHNLKVNVIPALGPIDVGYLAGEKKTDQTNKVMGYFQKYTSEKIPNGESIDDFRSRTQPAIRRMLIEGKKAVNPVVAAVHSSILHEVNHMLTGDHTQTLVKPGGIVGVYHHPEKGFALKALLYPSTGAGDSKYHG
jgi:uncharacterized phosphatase